MSIYICEADGADLLNVSYEYMAFLIDDGEIPFCGIVPYRLVRHEDVIAYKIERDAWREEGLRELVRLTEEAGGYPELHSEDGEA